jgi:hypothetical protein
MGVRSSQGRSVAIVGAERQLRAGVSPIDARAEGLSRSGDDDRTHFARALQRQQRVGQLAAELGVERVEALGAVERDGGHAGLDVDQQGLVAG